MEQQMKVGEAEAALRDQAVSSALSIPLHERTTIHELAWLLQAGLREQCEESARLNARLKAQAAAMAENEALHN